ncbi:MAG: hypothetical protein ACJA2M_000333 [Polaribacter sp.]|jgi:hypothetical protein
MKGMINYTGTKTLKAVSMKKEEYNSYRGWEQPSNEDSNEDGMLVEYIESGKPNHKNHDGYISWSPKDVFDKIYKQSETFYDRLLNQTRELATKTNSLNDFMRTKNFVDLDRVNKDLLYTQSRLMNEYLQVLGQRLELLGDKFSQNEM